jgi:hypothetical protein
MHTAIFSAILNTHSDYVMWSTKRKRYKSLYKQAKEIRTMMKPLWCKPYYASAVTLEIRSNGVLEDPNSKVKFVARIQTETPYRRLTKRFLVNENGNIVKAGKTGTINNLYHNSAELQAAIKGLIDNFRSSGDTK